MRSPTLPPPSRPIKPSAASRAVAACLTLLAWVGPVHAQDDASASTPCQLLIVESTDAPAPRLPTLRTFAQARRRIAGNRRLIDAHLGSVDRDRLQNALVWINGAAEHEAVNSPALRVLNELFDRAFATMMRDFRATFDKRKTELVTKHALAVEMNNHYSADKLKRAIARLGEGLDAANLEEFVAIWQLASKAHGRALVTMDPLVTNAGAVDRPIDEVDYLKVLGSIERRTELKRVFELAFRNEAAAAREDRRIARVVPGQRETVDGTYLPDLNRALTSLFEEPPLVRLLHSKVALRGRVQIDDATSGLVDVVMDPRIRYLTIRPSIEHGLNNVLYYRLRVEPDGRLSFLAPAPVSTEVVSIDLDETHFRY